MIQVREKTVRESDFQHSDEEHVICKFQKYGNAEAQAIKFWYNECKNENPGTFTPITEADQADYGEWSEQNNENTVMRSIAEPHDGAYIVSFSLRLRKVSIQMVSASRQRCHQIHIRQPYHKPSKIKLVRLQLSIE